MTDVKSMTMEELKEFMTKIGEKPFRAKQIYAWLQASGQSSDGRCTESASHTAAHLRRNAHRISVVIPHENTLNHISIFQPEQIFSGSVNV